MSHPRPRTALEPARGQPAVLGEVFMAPDSGTLAERIPLNANFDGDDSGFQKPYDGEKCWTFPGNRICMC